MELTAIKRKSGRSEIGRYGCYGLLFFIAAGIGLHPKLGSVLCGVFFFVGLFYIKKLPALERREKWFLASFLLFSLTTLLSALLSPDMEEGISKWGGRYATYMLAIPAYFMLAHYVAGGKSYFLKGVLLGILALLAWGVWGHFIESRYRVGGLMNPIVYGQIAGVFAVLVLGEVVVANRAWQLQLLYISFFLLAMYAVWLSLTRGVWLAIAIVLPAYIFLLGRYKAILFIALASVGIMILFVCESHALASLSRGVSGVLSYLEGASQCTSWEARISMWENSVYISINSPILGVGLSEYKEVMQAYVEEGNGQLMCPVIYQHHAHSIYFHTLMVSGLLGMFALLFMLFCSQYAIWTSKAPKENKVHSSSVILLFYVYGLSEAWTEKSLMVSFYIVCSLVVVSSLRRGVTNGPE